MQLAEELDRSIDFLTWELRPAALDRLGALGGARRPGPRVVGTLSHAGEYHGDGTHGRSLPSDVAVNLYRIVQEALHNVQKHARATHVSVLFTVRATR